MAQMTFNEFKLKLENTGEYPDTNTQEWGAPLIGDYEIEVDGNRLSVAMVLHCEQNNKLYIPNDDEELLETEQFEFGTADDVHDWKLLKATYTEE